MLEQEPISGAARREGLAPEMQQQLQRYIVLMDKWNRSAGTPDTLTPQESKELGNLRRALGDETIEQYVDASEVTGRVLLD